VWQRSIGNYFEYFEAFSEHGIFHGIPIWQENKPLNIKGKNGLLMRVGVTGVYKILIDKD
jgi:hypothetical protein